MKKTLRVAVALTALLLLGVIGAAVAFADDDVVSKDKKDQPKAGAKPGEAGAAGAKPEGKPGDDKPFDDVVKDMEVTKGIFTFYRKADENKILLEITPDQLDREFLFAATLDQALGERGVYGAQVLGDFPFVLHQVGKSIQLIQKNTAFYAPPGSPAARAVARSFPNSVLGAAKLQSKPHPDRKSLLIDPADLFVKDLPGFAAGLSRTYQPTSYTFDKEKSAIRGYKDFPENTLIEIALLYGTDNARTASVTMPDARSIPLVVKYDISVLKTTGYKPRLADDRVGHFINVMQDFTSDKPSTPYLRYINRWNLEKQDPSAALSPPKEPIVYWLENTIPLEYRDAVREGALLWNKAFEKVGFKDAVVVKQQPDDADWDPADTRYSTIRWFQGVDATFAIGPSRTNPYTGQIYDADISIADGIVRSARRLGEEVIAPTTQSLDEPAPWLATAWSRPERAQCSYGDGLAQQAALASAVLEARGALSPEVEAKLMHQYIVELVCHEVGHTLGLRHNFRGSSILKVGELNDVAKTASIGQSGSVMDYNPVIVALKGQTQGDFVPTTIGPYDYWAIEYAYTPIVGDEKPELDKIAARAGTDPMLPYSTDEDAVGTYSPVSIDPLANQYDQTDDPLTYFRTRVALINELWANMDTKLAKPGDGYQVYRRALSRGMNDEFRSLVTSSKMIGGIYHHRDHVGDPGGRLPYQPVPAAKQREALDFLATNAFGQKAFVIPASVQNKLAIERNPGLDPGYFGVTRIDYPWHDAVLAVQRAVLARLYNPITLSRVQDNELRFAAAEKPFKMADLFGGLNTAIWSELDAGASEVTSVRRNLQREQLKQLIRLALREAPPAAPSAGGFGPPAPPPPMAPEDATTLARASLVRIQGKLRAALAGKAVTDATTRAHFAETDARISAVLAAQVQRNLD